MIAFALAFAILNRARGSLFWDFFRSTQLTRLSATFCMATLCTTATGSLTAVWAWPLLMLWAIPGWGVYQSAATGNPTNFMEREFLPVDWLMKLAPCFASVYAATASDFQRRMWGAVAMGLRQTLAAPTVILLAYLTGQPAWYAIVTPLLALPYLAAGYLLKTNHVMWAEYGAGAMLGLAIHATIAG